MQSEHNYAILSSIIQLYNYMFRPLYLAIISFVFCLKSTYYITSVSNWRWDLVYNGNEISSPIRYTGYVIECSSLYMKALCLHIQWTTHTVNYTHAQWVRLRCHNTDLVHVNGHDSIILVIFSQALYKSPWWWILCDPKHVGALLNNI